MQKTTALRFYQRAPQVEAAVCQRQPVELEPQLALARVAVPAELCGGLGHSSKHDPVIVAQFERDLRRREIAVAGDDKPHSDRFAGSKLRALGAI